MREQGGGAIVTIARLIAFRAFADVAAYGASKAGVVALTQSLAIDWAPYHIRVNAIVPGVLPTELNRPLIEGTPGGRHLRDATAMQRFGEPSELGAATRYLLSSAAGFVTGTTLTVDGGFVPFGVGHP